MKFVSLVGTILGIAGIMGAAFAVLMAGRTKGTIEILKENNNALKENNDTLNQRVDTLEAIEDECQKRLDNLEQVNKILTETVTSAAKVQALEERLDAHHTEVLRRLDALVGGR